MSRTWPDVPGSYRPSTDEPFMNPVMAAYFRRKLERWRDQLLGDAEDTIHAMQEDSLNEADMADRAALESDWGRELRTRDRQRKLIAKIDAAMQRIEDGTYGFCEETAEPIGVDRLDARPIATLSIEAQERHERRERTQRAD
ncbi:MAG: RNA polymerase-binding protein DksA [Rhodospirillaceae bacterium]|nr:RNA polymerase-binding protein DksA [Rhodospirillaceae bacterium]